MDLSEKTSHLISLDIIYQINQLQSAIILEVTLGRIQGGVSGVYIPFRNDFVPVSLASFVYLYAMEGSKRWPIYPCTHSLKIQTKNCPIYPSIPLLKKPVFAYEPLPLISQGTTIFYRNIQLTGKTFQKETRQRGGG
jgi:hypothetical protein